MSLAGPPLDSFLDDRLEWLNEPASWGVTEGDAETEGFGGAASVSADGRTLTLAPPAKKDFWRRTFYTPTMIKGDASALLLRIPASEEATVEIDFSFTPRSQFDQAGVLVYLNATHWLKAGLEFADGESRLSCVCCNNYSDWSVVPWGRRTAARLRIHKVNQGTSVVLEANRAGGAEEDWEFVRICHLSAMSSHRGSAHEGELEAGGSEREMPWRVGPFAACSLAQRGCVATFTRFVVGPLKPMTHEADGNEFGV